VRTISDSSPIIALQAIDRLHLLRDIYGSVTVPPAVATEVNRFPLPHWIDVAPLPPETPHLDGVIGLGPGESEAIRLALTLLPNQILLDDGAARAAARKRGLSVIGVCGIALTALGSALGGSSSSSGGSAAGGSAPSGSSSQQTANPQILSVGTPNGATQAQGNQQTQHLVTLQVQSNDSHIVKVVQSNIATNGALRVAVKTA
jgi:uncharacterized protein